MMTEFFDVQFDNIAEAAGLVAALSRQLASPRVDLRDIGSVEVGIVARGAGAKVYLSAGALTATERAFGTPSRFSKVESVPADVVWILRDGEKKFLGRGDVLGQLIPDPPEPMHTQRTSIGLVKFWRDDKGYGVIESADTAPWDIWAHFSAIEANGFKSLTVGEQVEVTYLRANQDSYRYIARRVCRLSQEQG
ncbi:MAG TPA: cold shock domain-containing protein [Gemmatimonadaceae bacterium]|jgi:CspA family cold shock protein